MKFKTRAVLQLPKDDKRVAMTDVVTYADGSLSEQLAKLAQDVEESWPRENAILSPYGVILSVEIVAVKE